MIMTPIDDHNVPHEQQVADAVDDQLARTSTQAAITNAAVAAGATPTKAEYDALVAKFNLVLGVLRDSELIPAA
jgi:xanthine dehydrogenase iron-sulfur cluster and FAD-binding subunit A